MAQQVTTATTNVLHVFEVVYQKSKGAELNVEEKQFHSKPCYCAERVCKIFGIKNKGNAMERTIVEVGDGTAFELWSFVGFAESDY